MRAVSLTQPEIAGNTVATVYNNSSSDIAAGKAVQRDHSGSNALSVKIAAFPGAHADFVGITQDTLKAGDTRSCVVAKGHVYADVLATATTNVGVYLYPVTLSGSTYLKESKTRTNIQLRENITASAGSTVSAKVFLSGQSEERGQERLRHDIWAAPAVAASTAVHAAITGSASEVTVVTTAITNPDYPRNLSILPGGTTADVAAMSITVTGTDVYDATITEDFAFAANASTATVGTKAFKTVTQISIPIQDGGAATFAIGTGSKLGLSVPVTHTILGKAAFLGGTLEGTLPTLVGSTVAGESDGGKSKVSTSTATLNSALNSTQVDVYYTA